MRSEKNFLFQHISTRSHTRRGMFFNPSVPKYMNFGGVGSVIGHEISHGFDDQGRQSDGRGVLRNWWTDETLRRYKEKAQCVVDQYAGYRVEEVSYVTSGVITVFLRRYLRISTVLCFAYFCVGF